jgi:hypothetical protein
MATINDIQFDRDYTQASTHFLLLYHRHLDQPGPSVVVPLSHAHLLRFIHHFHDLFECKQHVSSNLAKMITLFVAENKLLDWHNSINDIDPNVFRVFIFCDTYHGFLKMKAWNGCYHEKVRDVFMREKLEYQMLYVGLDYIKTTCDEFREDNGVRDKFMADGGRVADALGSFFGQKATRLSQEAT